MSRLSVIDEGPAAERAPVFLLRRKRRRPLHPEQVQALLAEKADQRTGREIAFAPFGWLILLRRADDSKYYARTRAGASYEEAVRIRDEYLEGGEFESAWLIKKKEP